MYNETLGKEVLKIIGNNHKIPIEELINEEGEEITGFKYKGEVYSLSEFMRIDKNSDLRKYDGIYSFTVFSGLLIKIVISENIDFDAPYVKVYYYY
jgi:hypothetical protein